MVVPDVERRLETGGTEERHRFRTQGDTVLVHLRLLERDQPRAAVDYALEVVGEMREGRSDDAGELRETVPADAAEAVLRIRSEGAEEEYVLLLGHLDPVDTISGAQARLQNLDFDCGPIDGRFGPRTRAAVLEFQGHYGLETSGEIDSATRTKLESEHGC